MNLRAKEEEEEIEMKKGKILTNFSFIENFISLFVLKHYIKDQKLAEQIRNDIFESEYFSFYLKFNLFKTVLKKYYSKEIKEIKYNPEKIHELVNLRNLVAHSGLRMEIVTDSNGNHTYKKMSFSHGGERYEPEKIFLEYDELSDIIQPELIKLSEHLNIKILGKRIRSEDLKKIPD